MYFSIPYNILLKDTPLCRFVGRVTSQSVSGCFSIQLDSIRPKAPVYERYQGMVAAAV